MANHHPEAQWFNEAKFGVFLHWGTYSTKEIEASWPLMPHSSQHISVNEYEAMAEEFNPNAYDPYDWAKRIKAAGAKYAVLTTKHHDGYCLFETKTTDYCAPKTGPGRDLIAPYVDALHKEGLKVGLYFTMIDWHDPDFATIPISTGIQSPKPNSYDPVRWYEFHKRYMEQLRELLTQYGRIDLMWFDVPAFGADRWRSSEVKQMMLNLQPHLIVNDRLPGAGDYETPEQFIPHNPPTGLWEACMTLNHQWAYHPNTETYKSELQLLKVLAEVCGRGGNLLLNVGPKADGTWPEESIKRMDAIGAWLSYSGEAVYGTTRPPVHSPACFYGPVTCKGNTIYLYVSDIPREGVELRGVVGAVQQVRLLTTGAELPFKVNRSPSFWKKTEQVTWIDLKAEQCDPFMTVVAVDFEISPIWPEIGSSSTYGH
ncbi:alpha-L-fucosidase [Paenibacillus sp. LMG 31460]|uniref:alpha-L-fucosidase n=1 Tax=Paenibacillus germinis TaxID=2654979 RepID=A0ABX1ZA91_9BACL|nr:alpha-L-fucosidase [Paenibacillus germinis]NOU88760.1 alpha-L-fucosidase [Paenibacillus germinis]